MPQNNDNDLDHRILLGTLLEFKQTTSDELKEMKSDIKGLVKARWITAGVTTAVCFLITIVIQIIDFWRH